MRCTRPALQWVHRPLTDSPIRGAAFAQHGRCQLCLAETAACILAVECLAEQTVTPSAGAVPPSTYRQLPVHMSAAEAAAPNVLLWNWVVASVDH